LVRPASPAAHAFWLQVELMAMGAELNEQYLVRLRDVTASLIEQRAMWTFHGQISHKLRTPLNHLVASFDALDEQDLLALAPDTQSFLTIARKGAMRLKDEIQDIIGYIEAPNLIRMSQSSCSLAEIAAITDNIQSGLKLKPVKLKLEPFAKPDTQIIRLSRPVMELILWELFENAKKFHPDRSPAVELKVSRHAAKAHLKICDDGLTLPPDQLIKMWTPYYQVEKFFTGQIEGAGLGLAMVASLIWGVGGACRSYNREDGPGLVIELVLPMHQRPAGH